MGNNSRFWELALINEGAVKTDFTYFYLFLFSDSNHLLFLVLLSNPTVFLGSPVIKSEMKKISKHLRYMTPYFHILQIDANF